VLNGAEVNRVLDYAQNGLKRVINTVVPQVNADMLTYSSYDAMVYGTDAHRCNTASHSSGHNRKIGARSAGTGQPPHSDLRYGLFENEKPGDTWRADTVLSTAKNAGLYGAFFWNLYDNECKQNGQYSPVASAQGNPLRPTDAQCRGLWIIRPDGTTSSALDVIKKYW